MNRAMGNRFTLRNALPPLPRKYFPRRSTSPAMRSWHDSVTAAASAFR